MLIGQAPALIPADLALIKELSEPGTMCIYHVDLKSGGPPRHLITDIALQNPTDKGVKFGPTATVVIGVDEIMPLIQTGESMGNMSMGNSTQTKQSTGYADSKHIPFYFEVGFFLNVVITASRAFPY